MAWPWPRRRATGDRERRWRDHRLSRRDPWHYSESPARAHSERVESVRATPAAGRELTLGLTAAEAARRLIAEGRNETRPAAPVPIWSRVGRQIADPLIVLLLASATVTAIAGDITDTSVIVLVVVVNTVIGVVQEVRAEHAIAALRQLGAPTCRVVRDARSVTSGEPTPTCPISLPAPASYGLGPSRAVAVSGGSRVIAG